MLVKTAELELVSEEHTIFVLLSREHLLENILENRPVQLPYNHKPLLHAAGNPGSSPIHNQR